MKPAALKKGDTIGIFASSNKVSQTDLDNTKKYLESVGYSVFLHPQCSKELNQSAGTAQDKADAFHDLLQNPDIKAIFGARGGNRATTMLDKIDFNIVAANPKILLGYSDVSALLNANYAKTGLIGFHGPLARELPKRDKAETDQLFALLAGQITPYDFSGSRIINEGTAEGKLIGGNLSVLQALSGTDFQPDTDGAILFIEDTGDHISRYDRMLANLKLAGWFNKLSGVVVGGFDNTKDDPDSPFGFTLEDIIREHFDGLDIPIIMDAPFGHADKLCAMPLGGEAKLEAEKGQISFSLTESAVRP